LTTGFQSYVGFAPQMLSVDPPTLVRGRAGRVTDVGCRVDGAALPPNGSEPSLPPGWKYHASARTLEIGHDEYRVCALGTGAPGIEPVAFPTSQLMRIFGSDSNCALAVAKSIAG